MWRERGPRVTTCGTPSQPLVEVHGLYGGREPPFSWGPRASTKEGELNRLSLLLMMFGDKVSVSNGGSSGGGGGGVGEMGDGR
ncbi:hypothetical protein QYF36_018180 [Acer negundo]|nr:hypothetical protein QYF36_018180 [Acer negundo]